ncbi:MAG TPA: hypothetical protein VEB40_06365 [Flavipsychrobacter sp.]|nr:hypothetical protein [Flavipsychrobacter sp.]
MRLRPAVIFQLIFLFYSVTATAQSRAEQYETAVKRFSGCYQSGIESDGFLRLNADETFTWTKDKPRAGKWEMKNVFGIPFRATIIILRFEEGKKEKYEIDDGANSGKKAIALRGKWEMKETVCK